MRIFLSVICIRIHFRYKHATSLRSFLINIHHKGLLPNNLYRKCSGYDVSSSKFINESTPKRMIFVKIKPALVNKLSGVLRFF